MKQKKSKWGRPETLAARFAKNYVVTPGPLDTPCWLWAAFLAPDGHGRIDGLGAHRVSWALTTGEPVPPGLFVFARCRQRACVNPAHLYLAPGTSG